MVRAALEGRPIEIIDGGQFGADTVYLDDVAQALMLAVERGRLRRIPMKTLQCPAEHTPGTLDGGPAVKGIKQA